MDVSEEIKMLEEYKDALNVRLERVNKWLDGLRSGSTWIENEAPTFPITQQWGRAIISKYGALIDRDIIRTRSGIRLPLTACGTELTYVGCSRCWGIQTLRTAVYLKFNDQDLQDVYANVPF